MRALASLCAMAVLTACAASGPETLIEGVEPLPLDPTFVVRIPSDEGTVLNVSTDPSDATRLLGIQDNGSPRGSLRFHDLDLPDDFIVATFSAPQPESGDLAQLANLRTFSLTRCATDGTLRVFRPDPGARYLDGLPGTIEWDPEFRMLRLTAAHDLFAVLSGLITQAQLVEDYTDELPFPILCDALFEEAA